MTETKDKVYCCDCNHVIRHPANLGPIGLGGNPNADCRHPSNVENTDKPTWYSPNKNVTYQELPRVLNANNDCPNFVLH